MTVNIYSMSDNKNKYICFIPARSGSRRLKNKNLKKINNKTLIDITIRLAKKSKIFKNENIILSSDSTKILKIGKRNKIKYFKRSKKNSSNTAKADDAILETIKKINMNYKGIFILQVTSPLRKITTVKKFKKFCEMNKLEHCLTVSKISNYLSKYSKKYFNPNFKTRKRTQDLKPHFYENGLLYYVSKNFFDKYNKIYPKKNWNYYITDKYESLDINDKKDYEVCKKLKKI